LVQEFEGDVGFARTVAKAAFIAPDPVRAARRFVRDYQSVVRELTAQGMEPSIARSLAGIASPCGNPLNTACALVQKFHDVEDLVKRTHPQIARSVALGERQRSTVAECYACRGSALLRAGLSKKCSDVCT
jgi:hypothetical protein